MERRLKELQTYQLKKEGIQRKWWLVDARGKVLGRLCTEIASLLMGKHKPEFTPHLDMGDGVIVINASEVKLTGNKLLSKVYYRHSQYPGGLKKIIARDLKEKFPQRLITYAVRNMLPKNKLRRLRMRRLRVYPYEDYSNVAQKPEKIEFKEGVS